VWPEQFFADVESIPAERLGFNVLQPVAQVFCSLVKKPAGGLRSQPQVQEEANGGANVGEQAIAFGPVAEFGFGIDRGESGDGAFGPEAASCDIHAIFEDLLHLAMD